LGDVATNIMGKSARAILEALLAGQTDPVAPAELARGRLKAKRAQLEEALVGTVKPHHGFLLGEQLALIDPLDEAIERISQEIAQRLDPPPHPEAGSEYQGEHPHDGMRKEPQMPLTQEHHQQDRLLPWKQAVGLLHTIPGINERAAEGILAEVGIEMVRFPTAAHLASWVGMCPGNNESEGKWLSGQTRKGSPWLRKRLVEAAHAASHSKNTYLAALSHRIKARGEAKKALLAVAHAILVAIYHMLSSSFSGSMGPAPCMPPISCMSFI
jgi:transposase